MSGVMRPAPPHVIVVDTVATVSEAQAIAWRDHPLTPVRGVCRYLGSITPAERDAIFAAGLFIELVTYGDARSGGAPEGTQHGSQDVKQLVSIGCPPGVTVWSDLESFSGSALDCAAFYNARGGLHRGGGWDPGLYVGAAQPLDGVALAALVQDRYWQGLSVLKAPGAPAGYTIEPTVGWCQRQLPHTVMLAGAEVDVSITQYDWHGRLPNVWWPS
jgi:hypothetical protein